ncbi:keratin, type II cuticular Hb6-like [Haliotis rubra]|uniref:keratin, type II cuticular Hb6-like n=1 Tax=Haliotis rubra TaxID=36100 RepID=UPI001EE5624B|nr:keratin, type II cuticular Hb6-like [Haliotis rubra]
MRTNKRAAFKMLSKSSLPGSDVRCSEIKRPSRVRVDLNGVICPSTSTTVTTTPRESITVTTTNRQITSEVDNVRDSRQEEKTETQGFNERFAAFIEQVRFLEARIKHLFDMLASMANTTTSNI